MVQTKQFLTARVAKRKDLTDDLFILWLDLGESRDDFTFKPGQYCTIGYPEMGKGYLKPYSIVSAPHEPLIELFVEFIYPEHGGILTPHLHKLKVGDTLSMLPRPKGVFTFEPDFRNQVMVSTVTGVVPYVSMLRDYIRKGNSGHRFFVLQGASYWNEFGYFRELYDLSLRSIDVDGLSIIYIPTVSRPDEERNAKWRGVTGRVNVILGRFLWGLSPENSIVYACGNPGMIEDVKARLLPKGWRVEEERFWKED